MILRPARDLQVDDQVVLTRDVSTYTVIKKVLDLTNDDPVYVYNLRQHVNMPGVRVPMERTIRLRANDMVEVFV